MREEWRAVDHAEVERTVAGFSRKTGILVQTLTRSLLGREIPLIVLGEGEKSVLYVGAHHGMESVTAGVLLDFIGEYLAARVKNLTLFGTPTRYLFTRRRILIVPMLNPDGVEYAVHGVRWDNPLYARLLEMNGAAGADFSRWQANARGVDLNHNYDAGFFAYKEKERAAGILNGAPTRYSGEYPESEPETAALCRLLRGEGENLAGVLTLHTQGEEIYCGGSAPAKIAATGRALARRTGYRLALPEGPAAFGGLTDWCVGTLGKPSYTIECGRGENPLPPAVRPRVYARLRRALFEFPLLV